MLDNQTCLLMNTPIVVSHKLSFRRHASNTHCAIYYTNIYF